jgi:2-keto-4-pentenoate hydratase
VTLAGSVESCEVFRLDSEAVAHAVRSLHDVARVAPFTNNSVIVLGSAVEQWDSLVWRRHDAVRALAVIWADPVVEK